MGGGLIQLVAYGAQDVYLTGNPQITFFKIVYRRHTNFATEDISQTFSGTAAFKSKATCPITRNGDLITSTMLHTTLTLKAGDIDTSGNAIMPVELVQYAGYALIDAVELQIGGTKIDKHYGKWLYIWSQLSTPVGKWHSLNTLLGNVNTSTMVENGPTFSNMVLGANGSPHKVELMVPLAFFFNRNNGLALPLIALQYHDVRLEFDFADVNTVAVNGGSFQSNPSNLQMSETELLVRYIYLDSEERKRFAQASHEYLIEQLQFTGAETIVPSSSSNSVSNHNIRLNFNHPVKQLVWAIDQTSAATADTTATKFVNFTNNNVFSGTNPSGNPVNSAIVQLNGHDRFDEQSGMYFNHLQPYLHHSASPSAGINVYSFALHPEEHQPSGTCNFSRIDNATLRLKVTTGEVAAETGNLLYVYAVNYNVLRIMSGMGGIAYSN